jgi:Flp pilus assembly protein TadG
MTRIRAGASFLSRLGRDASGNTLALVAAAMVPLAGLIGGGVDMSRLYLTKTRLQQACDAGALAGRKAMAGESWTTGANSTQSRANAMFSVNFQSGSYGTGATEPRYTEDDGTVNGTATVAVPMTIMKIFGMTSRNLTVNCTAKMEIPNTDVMFVLDVTYSMSGSRITGLKSAVKCFYEALLKVNTPEVCSTPPATDPAATAYTGTAQIRLGFVPYAVNVNVGKLLKNDYMADSWTYQSRTPIEQNVYAWTVANETAVSYGDWSSAPTNLNTQSSYSNWNNVSGSGSVSVNGTNRTKNPNLNETNCLALNTMGAAPKMLDYVDASSIAATSTTSPPIHPATQQTLNYTETDTHTVTGYKYAWSSSKCRLQSATRTYTKTRTGTSSKTVTWQPYVNHVAGWTYGPRTFTVSALKAGNSAWNNDVTLPGVGYTTGPTVKLSGSNMNTQIRYKADLTTTWDGCIEERQTVQNTDGDPSDDWGTIPTSAYDMNIDMLPSSTVANSHWGPMLDEAVWGRYSGNTSNRAFDPLVSPDNQSRNFSYYCSNPARKLKEYKTAAEVTDFVSYINGLTVTDMGTYHDIGMLWGGRFLSPTGIFASQNVESGNGGNIQRHLIFMTDGNAQTVKNNYVAHGLHFYDRKQTSYDPTETQLNNLTNARLLALCTQIKNKNITLWVISYGGGVDEANEGRLSQCASPGGHFYSAANGAELRAKFKQIAAAIADLRLTS